MTAAPARLSLHIVVINNAKVVIKSFGKNKQSYIICLQWANFYYFQCRVWVGQILKFVELILFVKTNFWGGLAPSCQTVGSLVIPPGWQSRPINDLNIVSKDSTNWKIWPAQTFPLSRVEIFLAQGIRVCTVYVYSCLWLDMAMIAMLTMSVRTSAVVNRYTFSSLVRHVPTWFVGFLG